MARTAPAPRPSTSAPTEQAEVTPSQPTVESARDTTTDVTVGATGAPTSSTEQPEPDFDLTAFEAAATAAASAEADPNAESLIDSVNVEYNKLSRKGKTAAQKFCNEQTREAVMVAKDKDLAFAWGTIGSSLKSEKASSGSSTPKAPANPTESTLERLAGLYLAYKTASENVPQGMDEGWDKLLAAKVGDTATHSEIEKLVTYRNSTDEDKGDAPDVSEIAQRAVRLAFQGTSTRKAAGASTGGSGVTYSGPRRSIAAHMASAFAGEPVGTWLSVSQISGHKSAEYGDDRPSPGAITAALKSGKSLPEGIRPDSGGPKGQAGARKVA